MNDGLNPDFNRVRNPTMADTAQIVLGFADQSQPLDQIIQSSNLPTVIKYDTTQELEPNLVSPEFDPTQTYLLHSMHELCRVHARSATFHPEKKCFEDAGLDVTVDEQYTGWFAVFGNPSDHRSDPVVPHFRSIGKLAISQCHTFLVSGRQSLEAMKVFRHDNGSKSLNPFKIYPGAVLTKQAMYTVSLKIKIKKSLLKSKVEHKDETYLACKDESNNEMLISCQASGIFYVLAQVSGSPKVPIMKLEGILSRCDFPLVVKLVHGHLTKMPPSCKGTFILLQSHQVKASFASTIYAPQPHLVEITADASLRFFNATNKPDFDNDNAFSRAFQNFSNKMPALLQTIRLRSNDQGAISARSSATSGHGSGLSDDDEKLDWSKITVCSNEPFIESVDAPDNVKPLFTRHCIEKPASLQTQIISPTSDKKGKALSKSIPQRPKDKDQKRKVKATTIKKSTLYDSPKPLKLDPIPIVLHRRFSQESNESTPSHRQHIYGNLTSPTNSSFSEDTDPQSEYAPIWSDTSSVTSSESLEVDVENVTHTGVSSQNDREYANLSSVLAATVRMRNKHRKPLPMIVKNDEPPVQNMYDVLSDNSYRNTYRTSYKTLVQPIDDKSTFPATPDENRDCVENIQYAEGGQSSSSKVLPNTSKVYEEPNRGSYKRPKNGTYEKPNAGNYEPPEPESYVTPTPQKYGESESNDHQDFDNSYQDEENIYERMDDIYDYIVDIEPPATQAPMQYANESKSSEYVNQSETISMNTSASSCLNDDYLNLQTLSASETDANTIPPSSSEATGEERSVLENLLCSMKSLSLKAKTKEAIKSADEKAIESVLGGKDYKTGLLELFPDMNKIDLNKISLFLGGYEVYS